MEISGDHAPATCERTAGATTSGTSSTTMIQSPALGASSKDACEHGTHAVTMQHADHSDDDGLTFPRGFMIGLPISLLLWAIIAWLIVRVGITWP